MNIRKIRFFIPKSNQYPKSNKINVYQLENESLNNPLFFIYAKYSKKYVLKLIDELNAKQIFDKLTKNTLVYIKVLIKQLEIF